MKPYYQDEWVTIYHGDCREILPELPKVDLVLTSPPYDNVRDYGGYSFDYSVISRMLYEKTVDGGVVVWVVGDATIDGSETGTSFRQALRFMEVGFNLHDTMIIEREYTKTASKIWDKINKTTRKEQIVIWEKSTW
jgi:site-specific DNA-methyltransferase (adenine-specific)